MYINFYGDKIEYAIRIPVFAYKISTNVIEKGSSIDVLGETILKVIEEGATLDIDSLIRMIGIPYKYRKLVEYEINELLDNNKIKLDENGKILKKSIYEKTTEDFYVLYDKSNKIFLDCIIPINEFEKRYLKKNIFNNDKSYLVSSIVKNKDINKYGVCYRIQELITKSNSLTNLNNENEDVFEYRDEEYVFIRPFYKINLDIVENIDNPIDTEFLIKVFMNQNQNIEYEDPFTNENTSIYIDRYIKNKIDESKLLKILNDNNEFMYIEKCKDNSIDYIKEYEQLDKFETRLNYIEKISLYRELLSLKSDIYKNFSLATIEIEKIVKSLLKDLIENFKESKVELKNIKISGLDSNHKMDSVKNIKIISTIINQNHKIIYKDKKVINSIGESSISTYLKCIYISKFLTNDKYESKVFDVFSNDYRLVQFLNDIWLYRNNTSHNIEKYKFYNPQYDMEIMYKERLLEVTQYLTNELLYFVQVIKNI